MQDEFGLIDAIVAGLGDRAAGQWVTVGPGDDAAVLEVSPGTQHVASIDSLLADVHFPASAPAQLIGYRALMVAFSDLAAMAAAPRYCLVALSLDQPQLAAGSPWVVSLAAGMAEAARQLGVYVCGGNLSRGPLNITVSVHGEIEPRDLLLRSGASAGDSLYVTGHLGAAAACVRHQQMLPVNPDRLSSLQRAYYRPQARFDVTPMCEFATAGLDISDGLTQDLWHLCRASGCGANLESAGIPVAQEATLDDALFGGDDYQLLLSSQRPLPGAYRIGELTTEPGLTLDGKALNAGGYDHFRVDGQ